MTFFWLKLLGRCKYCRILRKDSLQGIHLLCTTPSYNHQVLISLIDWTIAGFADFTISVFVAIVFLYRGAVVCSTECRLLLGFEMAKIWYTPKTAQSSCIQRLCCLDLWFRRCSFILHCYFLKLIWLSKLHSTGLKHAIRTSAFCEMHRWVFLPFQKDGIYSVFKLFSPVRLR